MKDAAAILTLDHVRIDAGDWYDVAIENASLTLHAGELVLILVDPEHAHTPLADAVCGIAPAERGSIAYEGIDWTHRTPVDAARARGRIGRVFETGGWVNNLSVGENVTLARRHHGDDPEQTVYDQAADIARLFDLPGLPIQPVHRTLDRDLRRAACIRALLGRPSLLVLERPTRGVFNELMPQLVNAVREARARGAAVVWITSDLNVFNSRSLRTTARLRMYGSNLANIEESSPCRESNPPAGSNGPSASSSSLAS